MNTEMTIKTYKCECCDYVTNNPRQFANHVRWTHQCPDKSKEREEFTEKMRLVFSEKNPYITKQCICEKCGKEFSQTLKESEWNIKKKVKRFCSRSCANSRERSIEVRQKMQQSLIKTLGSDIVKNLKINRICPVCGKEFFGKKETCSMKCRGKWHHINYMKTDTILYEDYRKKCSFRFSLKDFPEEFDFSLIEKYGWYSSETSKNPNLYGVSRDHIISIKYGWEHNISPDIISHPANCKLLRQSENASKGTQCGLTYEELLEKIENWNKKYSNI